MAAKQKTQKADVQASEKHAHHDDVSLVDILTLAENSIGSLKKILDTFDAKIYSEFREIAEQISLTKSEMGQLGASEMRQGKIPEAGKELAAIVDATEDATHRIMEAAETIMTADPSDVGTYYKTVNDNVMAIFEACSFQDLTGQRISRVVETLEFIDKRVSRFAAKMGAYSEDPQSGHEAHHYFDADEKRRAERKKDLLLNGPQDRSVAVSQSDVDSLLK